MKPVVSEGAVLLNDHLPETSIRGSAVFYLWWVILWSAQVHTAARDNVTVISNMISKDCELEDCSAHGDVCQT